MFGRFDEERSPGEPAHKPVPFEESPGDRSVSRRVFREGGGALRENLLGEPFVRAGLGDVHTACEHRKGASPAFETAGVGGGVNPKRQTAHNRERPRELASEGFREKLSALSGFPRSYYREGVFRAGRQCP